MAITANGAKNAVNGTNLSASVQRRRPFITVFVLVAGNAALLQTYSQPVTHIGAAEKRCVHIESPSIAGLAGGDGILVREGTDLSFVDEYALTFLLHAFVCVPVARELANVEDLTRVVGVVGVDVGDGLEPVAEPGVVGFFYGLFPLRHDIVELFYRGGPGLFREIGKGRVVVAIEGGGFSSIEFVERLFVPKQQMIGELAYGVARVIGFPHGLLSCESVDGDAYGNEPFFFIPGSLELFEEDGAECRCGLLLGENGRCAAEHGDDQKGVTHGFLIDIGQI